MDRVGGDRVVDLVAIEINGAGFRIDPRVERRGNVRDSAGEHVGARE